MTMGIIDWPEDPDDHSQLEFDEFLGTAFSGALRDDVLAVEFLIDHRHSRLSDVFTKGLWWMGIPELCVSLPANLNQRGKRDWGQLAMFLALGLVSLGSELIRVDHLALPPHVGEFEGRPVELWLGKQEPAEGRLALALGDDVDTIIRVECSLWHPYPPSSPPTN